MAEFTSNQVDPKRANSGHFDYAEINRLLVQTEIKRLFTKRLIDIRLSANTAFPTLHITLLISKSLGGTK